MDNKPVRFRIAAVLALVGIGLLVAAGTLAASQGAGAAKPYTASRSVSHPAGQLTRQYPLGHRRLCCSSSGSTSPRPPSRTSAAPSRHTGGGGSGRAAVVAIVAFISVALAATAAWWTRARKVVHRRQPADDDSPHAFILRTQLSLAAAESGMSLPSHGAALAPSTGIRSVARGGSLALFGYVVSAGLQFLLVLVITHGLTASAAGVFFEAVALFTILSNWGELGADTGAVREVSRLRAVGRAGDIAPALIAALIPVVVFGLLALALVFGFAHGLGNAFFHSTHRGRAVSYLRLFALFLPASSACTVILAATRGFGTMRPYVAIQNVALPAARPLLVGIAVVTGLGSIAVGLAWALPLAFALVASVVSLLVLLRRLRAPGGARPAPSRPSRAIATEFWSFAAPRGLAGVFGVTVTWLDVLLVGAYTSSRQAAIYAAASRLAVLGTYGLYAVGMALAPQFSRLLAGAHIDRVQMLYRVSTWWIMALCCPLYVTFAVYGRTLMSMFGARYVSGDVALLILALGGLFNLGTGNVTVVLLMSGHSGWNMFNAALSLVVNVVLNLILIPRMGITGAATAWAASIVVNNLAALIQVRVLLGVRPFGRVYLRIAATSALTYGVLGALVRWQTAGSLAGFAGFCLLATAVYLILLWHGRDALQLPELGRSLRGASAAV